jgi:hypothetical protein
MVQRMLLNKHSRHEVAVQLIHTRDTMKMGISQIWHRQQLSHRLRPNLGEVPVWIKSDDHNWGEVVSSRKQTGGKMRR